MIATDVMLSTAHYHIIVSYHLTEETLYRPRTAFVASLSKPKRVGSINCTQEYQQYHSIESLEDSMSRFPHATLVHLAAMGTFFIGALPTTSASAKNLLRGRDDDKKKLHQPSARK